MLLVTLFHFSLPSLTLSLPPFLSHGFSSRENNNNNNNNNNNYSPLISTQNKQNKTSSTPTSTQNMSYHILLLLLTTLLILTPYSNSEPTQDKQSLLSFISQIPHSPRLNWNNSVSTCSWHGVKCDPSNSYVLSLRLPAIGLYGQIPLNTIGRLSHLRVLSIHSNHLTGPLPRDFSNLTLLRSLYVGHNSLTGEFPSSLTQLTRLTRLDLSNNGFTGPIPFDINNLSNLNGLYLDNNNFNGQIPSISADLKEFNVSNNNLNGSIPKTLSKFPASSFAGNLQLCGGPLQRCNSSFFPTPPSQSPDAVVPSSPAELGRKKKKKLSKAAIIGISVAAAAALFLGILLCLVLCCLLRRKKNSSAKSTAPKNGFAATGTRGVTALGGGGGEAGTSSSKDDLTSGTGPEGAERNKLVFVSGGGGYNFDLEDLLRASAEVLGKGSVGTSYKAVLEEGTTVVVKRLKDFVAGKREFEVQMEVLGKCKHENVLPIRAYYFSKDEKLLVSHYLTNGSLSSLLHGINLYSNLYFTTIAIIDLQLLACFSDFICSIIKLISEDLILC